MTNGIRFGVILFCVGIAVGLLMSRAPRQVTHIRSDAARLPVTSWPDAMQLYPPIVGMIIKTDRGCYISTGTARGSWSPDPILAKTFPEDCANVAGPKK